MADHQFEVVQSGLRDTSEAERAADLDYHCTRCGTAIPSQPCDSKLASRRGPSD